MRYIYSIFLIIIITGCSDVVSIDRNSPVATPENEVNSLSASTDNLTPTIIDDTPQPKSQIPVPEEVIKPASDELIVTPERDISAEAVSFKSEDDDTLSGIMFDGGGDILTVIVLGPDETEAMWQRTAKIIASQGFKVLIYKPATSPNSTQMVENIKQAIEYGKNQGANEHVIIGVGAHGIAAAKVAGESAAKALVLYSTPVSIGDAELTANDMQAISGPKLFIDSENSPTQPDAVQLFELAENPKTWAFWPGTEQGAALYNNPETAEKLDNFMSVFFLYRLAD